MFSQDQMIPADTWNPRGEAGGAPEVRLVRLLTAMSEPGWAQSKAVAVR